MGGLFTLVEFDEGDKWFVTAEKEIDGFKYSYLIRVNDTEDDFIDEFQLVKSFYENGEEYMETVVDIEEEKKILPILIPEADTISKDEELLKLLRKASN
ncbi:MAG: hypothetical protein IKJ43_03970 [Bacilli bacterium]|nr:hypothetical protein [Bacilli bacterium]